MPESDDAAPAARRADTRRIRRLPAKGGTRLRAYRNEMGLGPNIGVRVLDVSATGARLVLREALPVGRRIEATLEGQGGQVLKAAATVVWCVDAGDGTHVAGVSLDREAGHSLLAALARC